MEPRKKEKDMKEKIMNELVMISAAVGFCVVCAAAALFIVRKYKKLFKDMLTKFEKIQNEKISSEVRIGKIGENMAPFLKDWPYDPNDFRFLGNPIDGIQFTNDEVIFVEIKTGKSRLSRGQRNLRDIVRSKKVSFATFRVSEHGCELKREELD